MRHLYQAAVLKWFVISLLDYNRTLSSTEGYQWAEVQQSYSSFKVLMHSAWIPTRWIILTSFFLQPQKRININLSLFYGPKQVEHNCQVETKRDGTSAQMCEGHLCLSVFSLNKAQWNISFYYLMVSEETKGSWQH